MSGPPNRDPPPLAEQFNPCPVPFVGLEAFSFSPSVTRVVIICCAYIDPLL